MILQKLSKSYTLILTLSATALHASLLRPQSLGSESALLEQLSDPGAQFYPWRGCELTGPIYPGGDQLPSADRLFDSDEAFEKQIARLQAVVEVDSVCYDDLRDIGLDDRWEPFEKLGNRLEENYPLMHQDKRVTLERINTFGLVYTLEGEDDHELKPILLTAHQDVVPVGDEADWTYPPFSATYDGEWMWGRGVADDKNRLTAIMSVFESLLSFNEWQPRRTFVIALGFDEECSGLRGARNISDYLYNRYEENGIEAIIDEGGLGMI